MRISKSVIKSSHDMALIVLAAVAIAMIVSAMFHNSRIFPASWGMGAAVTVADSRVAPHCVS